MLVAYKYCVYPKLRQGRRLKRHLAALCTLYNALRDLKINMWKKRRISLKLGDLRQAALEKRRNDKDLQGIHSQVVQHIAARVARAFKNYFDGKARFPKHKKPRKYRSLTYPQSGFKLCGEVIKKGNRTELEGKLSLKNRLRSNLHAQAVEGKSEEPNSQVRCW